MLIEYLKQLIKFRTISNDKKENGVALDWLEEKVKDLPVFVRRFEKNNIQSLFISTKQNKNPKVMLAAHIDVVSGSDDMFEPIIANGKIYGRGAYDMKFAIACYLELFHDLKEDLTNLDIGIMITSDEEVGGLNGTNYLLKKEKFSAGICVLPDGGKSWELITESKGILQVKVKATGKSAHGSSPWEGDSAIDSLINFIQKIKSDNIFDENYYQRDEEHYCNTINIGKISGGEVANKVADAAEAILDIRFVSKENESKMLNIIKYLAKGSGKIKIEKVISGYPSKIDEENGYVKEFIKIAQQNGVNIKSTFSHGTSDARFFSEKNILTIVINPIGGGHHSEEEWIDIESLNSFYKVLKAFVINIS